MGPVNESGNGSDLCYDYPVSVTFPRFVIISCIASPIAFLGVVANICLLRFFARKQNRNSPTLYLAVLALLDSLICLCYIIIFGVRVFADYQRVGWMYFFWVYAAIPAFTVSRIVQLSSSYIIMGATVERCILSSPRLTVTRLGILAKPRSRVIIITIILLTSSALRIITFWELEIRTKPDCDYLLGSVDIGRTGIISTRGHKNFDFYFLAIIQIFIPFMILLILNLANLKFLKLQARAQEARRRKANPLANVLSPKLVRASISENWDSTSPEDPSPCTEQKNTQLTVANGNGASSNELTPMAMGALSAGIFRQRISNQRERELEQRRVKSAAYTLMAIVTSYLICNALSLFITILERLPGSPLLWKEPGIPTALYTVSVDMVSFLFMFNSFARFFIYFGLNPDMRKAMRQYLCERAPYPDAVPLRSTDTSTNNTARTAV